MALLQRTNYGREILAGGGDNREEPDSRLRDIDNQETGEGLISQNDGLWKKRALRAGGGDDQ